MVLSDFFIASLSDGLLKRAFELLQSIWQLLFISNKKSFSILFWANIKQLSFVEMIEIFLYNIKLAKLDMLKVF